MSVARPAFEVWYKSLMKLWNANKVPGPSIAQATMGDLDKAIEQGSVIVGAPDTVRAAIKDQIERLGVNYMTFAFYFGSFGRVGQISRAFRVREIVSLLFCCGCFKKFLRPKQTLWSVPEEIFYFLGQ